MVPKDQLNTSVQLLIRRPASEVFTAFVDPAVTTRFWFTKSSGKLEPGSTVEWEWEMYGARASITVKTLEPPARIVVDWGEPPREVEWVFAARPDNTTLVTVTERGFAGSDAEIIAAALDSKGGFTVVLAGLKALLEHDLELNLVGDQHPDAHVH